MKIFFNKKINFSAGYTFLELMVVIFIFGVIAGIVLFNYKDFTSGINIQNTSQEIALRIVQAQRYAISGNISNVGPSTLGTPIYPSFGVYFNLNTSAVPISFNSSIDSDKQFVFYTNFDSDYQFNETTCGQAGSTECLDLVTINNGDRIEDICINKNNSSLPVQGCYSSGDIAMPVNIFFQRPFPDGHFIILDSGSNEYAVSDIGDIEIKVTSVQNISREIVIWSTGQVSVENSN